MWLWIIALLLLLYVVYNYLDPRFRAVEKMFSGPTYIPIFGNALCAVGKKSDDIYGLAEAFCRDHPGSFRIWLGPLLYIVLNEPKDLEILLSSTEALDKADLYSLLHAGLGQGLVTSTGDRWKTHRKMLTPAFGFKNLQRFVQVFHSNNEILCNKLMTYVDGTPFDVQKEIKMYTFDNIIESAMGVRTNAQKDCNSEYVKAVHDESSIVGLRVVKFWLRPDWVFNRTGLRYISDEARRIGQQFTRHVIRQRREEFQQRGDDDDVKEKETENDDLNMKTRHPFLDVLLRAEKKGEVTEADIICEVDTFIVAGYETLAASMSFALYSIAQDKTIQDKVMRELEGIFGEDDRAPTYRDLQEMKYLEQVLKETLRLYPSAPAIGRAMRQDLQLSEGRYLPKGCDVLIWIPAVHTNPAYWENPHQFDPEHFSQEAMQRRHPYAYLPFSAGPRNCLGQKFALLEMKSAISVILRKFQLLPSSNPKDKINLNTVLVLGSTNGMNICIKKRHQTSSK